jgi:DNA-binding NtrC family response regulator
MNETSPIVFVVDDDPSVCLSLKRLLRAVGLETRTFAFPDGAAWIFRRNLLLRRLTFQLFFSLATVTSRCRFGP